MDGENYPTPAHSPISSYHHYPPYSSSPYPPPRQRRWLLWGGLAFLIGAVVLLWTGAMVGLIVGRMLVGSGQVPVQSAEQARVVPGSTATSSQALAVAGRVAPGVVDVNTVIQGIDRNGAAAGTGMILTSNGQILTNNHVVAGASSIRVTIAGHSQPVPATVVGTDSTDDVALIQAQGVSGLATVSIASSPKLSVGESLIAIGNALGRGGAPEVTEGQITALDQSITASDGPGTASRQLTGMIETDAPIVPGDSGGPLVNRNGQVIGMITAGQATAGRQDASTSIGFAIPSGNALKVVTAIRSGQASSSIILGQPAYLGVEATDLDPSTAARLGLPISSGALIEGIVPGSPAASIGLQANAVITSIGSHQVTSVSNLGTVLRSYKPGQNIEVTWTDASGSHTGTATLAAGPAA